MEDRLYLPAPNKAIERVHAIAYDIAYGVSQGMWDTSITIQPEIGGPEEWATLSTSELQSNYFNSHILGKWDTKLPSSYMMLTFGYFEALSSNNTYILTSKAFALLEQPSKPPSVFISYKQTESSALALLIESRLKNVDENVSIFIDKNIGSGESINSRIEEALGRSRYFICLLGPNTLSISSAVKIEIDLAKKNTDCTIIPICHSGYVPDDTYTQYFSDSKAMVIKQPDSAEEYETNMTKLLIRLGYSTI